MGQSVSICHMEDIPPSTADQVSDKPMKKQQNVEYDQHGRYSPEECDTFATNTKNQIREIYDFCFLGHINPIVQKLDLTGLV